MLIAGKNNRRFLGEMESLGKVYLPTTFITITADIHKNKYGGLCVLPRHDAAIGDRGADFVW
jgi:hypothetical protein